MADHHFKDPVLTQISLHYSYDKKRHDANNQETIRLLREYIKKLEEKKNHNCIKNTTPEF